MVRQRLDNLLVRRGHYGTRARARDAIRRGTVSVGGRIAKKPGEGAEEGADIVVLDRAQPYVSRAALKLLHALDHFAISPAGLHALDIGASTGGFTQVLLERGARHVTAIDVGRGQLAEQLKSDPRVTCLEGLNARDFDAGQIAKPIQFITADLSFISLKLALPKALAVAEPGATLVALIKPQFEAGRGRPDHAKICKDIAAWLTEQGWRVLDIVSSPIEGGDGNREFLIAAEKPR